MKRPHVLEVPLTEAEQEAARELGTLLGLSPAAAVRRAMVDRLEVERAQASARNPEDATHRRRAPRPQAREHHAGAVEQEGPRAEHEAPSVEHAPGERFVERDDSQAPPPIGRVDVSRLRGRSPGLSKARAPARG